MKPAERLRELAREAEGGCGELWSADIALLRAAADFLEDGEVLSGFIQGDSIPLSNFRLSLKRVQEACDEPG